MLHHLTKLTITRPLWISFYFFKFMQPLSPVFPTWGLCNLPRYPNFSNLMCAIVYKWMSPMDSKLPKFALQLTLTLSLNFLPCVWAIPVCHIRTQNQPFTLIREENNLSQTAGCWDWHHFVKIGIPINHVDVMFSSWGWLILFVIYCQAVSSEVTLSAVYRL